MVENIAWYEKYRPTSFQQILSQDLQAIEIMANNNQLPHLLIFGPPGTGKRTTAMLIAERLLEPANIVKGLGIFDGNAVGREVFYRSAIYKFSRIILPEITNSPRICYIYNADGLPQQFWLEFHQYLQRVPDNMRVVFSCKEDECPELERKFLELFGQIVLRFKPVDPDAASTVLLRICQWENLSWDSLGIETLLDIAKGNMKLALAYLQQAFMLTVRVDMAHVLMIQHLPNPLEVYQTIQCCLKANVDNAKGMVIGFFLAGNTYKQIVDALKRAILIHNPIHEFIRAKYLEVIEHIPVLLPIGERYEMSNLRMLMHIFCDFSYRCNITTPSANWPHSSSSSSSSSSTSTSAARPSPKVVVLAMPDQPPAYDLDADYDK